MSNDAEKARMQDLAFQLLAASQQKTVETHLEEKRSTQNNTSNNDDKLHKMYEDRLRTLDELSKLKDLIMERDARTIESQRQEIEKLKLKIDELETSKKQKLADDQVLSLDFWFSIPISILRKFLGKIANIIVHFGASLPAQN
ncbi:uncharacterized protein LOC119077760 [Bradysia coprophila]|uniref:uncharacterized protein LOC119077760 n=1 Tax=Bradysia coprophila TaxID=38358 RepID=UPI00187D8468|nr:uncharacterized protein LOC119077760 [Bradysia coprophila]